MAPPPTAAAAAASSSTAAAASTAQQQQPQRRRVRPQWREAVAGACAGALSRTLLAPVERVKLLKQLRGSASTSSANGSTGLFASLHHVPHPSAWQVAQAVYTEQGLAAFWRGNVPSMLRVSGTAAVNFTCMDYYKRVAVGPWLDYYYDWTRQRHNSSSNNDSSSAQQQQQRQRQRIASFVSGGLAGATATTLLYPVEFVRTRLALDVGGGGGAGSVGSAGSSDSKKTTTTTTTTTNNTQQQPQRPPRQYAGMRDVFRKIVRSDGVTGLFQGYGVALAGGVFYRVLLLGGYDALKGEVLFWRQRQQEEEQKEQRINQQQQQPQKETTTTAAAVEVELSWWERIVAAQGISLTAGTLSYPFDSVRRRMMMQAGVARQERRFRSSLHCIVTVWQQEGLRGFYLGLGPNVVRSVSGALLLVGYDRVRTLL